MDKIEIGVITGAHGVRGEVNVKSFAEDPGRFRKVRELFLKPSGKLMSGHGEAETGPGYEVERTAFKGPVVILKLAGIDTREDAEKLRGYTVSMDEKELEVLPQGSFYVRDLIGMDVVTYETGEKLGEVKDVLTDRPQDLYVVANENGGRDILIPAVDEFIKDIDPESRVIKVELIDGMM